MNRGALKQIQGFLLTYADLENADSLACDESADIDRTANFTYYFL